MSDQEPTNSAGTAKTSDRGSRGGPWGFILTLVVALAVFVGVGVFFWSRTYKSPAGTLVAQDVGVATVNGVSLPHVTLNLDTWPDSSGIVNGVAVHQDGNPAWPTYGPTNIFQVPAHALVTVTIRQYDSGGSLNNAWFDEVRGTVGGVAIIDGKTVRSINPNNVGHTFTVRGAPGVDPGFFVNVPLPLANTNNNEDSGPYCFSAQYLSEPSSVRQNNPCYNTIVFSFVSGSAGVYAWNCEFPCGTSIVSFGGPMSTFGYMSGFLRVV
jgi:hypothetical protein